MTAMSMVFGAIAGPLDPRLSDRMSCTRLAGSKTSATCPTHPSVRSLPMTTSPPRTNIGDLPLREQITIQITRILQNDGEYWRGQIDALNWVLRAIDNRTHNRIDQP